MIARRAVKEPSPERAAVHKDQYLLWGARDLLPGAFAARLRGQGLSAIAALGRFDLKLTLTESSPPALSVIPLRRRPIALLSLTGAALPDPGAVHDALALHGDEVAGYRVVESVPRAYERDWPDGQRTPGVGLLTLFRRRRGLSDEDFIARWHGGHTPLTFRIHPVWNYVRNVVESSHFDGSPPFDGIVEEHFRTRRELLRPPVFFGGPHLMVPNMVRVGLDIRRFIDLQTMEVYLVVEEHVRSASGL